jgi:hypothetical protein
MPPDVFFEIIKEPSIKETKPKIVTIVETPDWRAEIMAYLRGHHEPQDELEEEKVEEKGKGLCDNQWRTVQVKSYQTMAKMHYLRKRC